MTPDVAARRAAFRKLHERGCFVIPNPWDVGTARYLRHLGFKALASTSAGFAFSRGLPDTAVGRDAVLAHLRELVAATELPVNADYENAFADDPRGVAENVRLCVGTGVAGVSVEDSTGRRDEPLYEIGLAVERIRAARAAIDATGEDVLLVGRAECFLVRHPDPLNESVKRLVAYAKAGADCLYAPGLHTREQIEAVVKAVAPKPVNVLMTGQIGFTVAELEDLGVRRISVGSALAAAAWGGFLKMARGIAAEGRFDAFKEEATFAELNKFFAQDLAQRSR
jgi:2-methylisocitrate lyase-like PEP mutase family enzyme